MKNKNVFDEKLSILRTLRGSTHLISFITFSTNLFFFLFCIISEKRINGSQNFWITVFGFGDGMMEMIIKDFSLIGQIEKIIVIVFFFFIYSSIGQRHFITIADKTLINLFSLRANQLFLILISFF